MMKRNLLLFVYIVAALSAFAQRQWRVRTIPLDSIVMSDPCILADDATQMYYMTGTGGMLWTSWVFGDYTHGVAYSESGTLDGPWIQEPEPVTPPNYGHGMLFRTLEGRLMMSVHSHEKRNGRTHRVPHLFPVDDSGDKIKVITEEEKPEAYLMVYHKDQDHGLHMAYSEDGYTWTALNDDKAIIAGDTIAEQHGIRDPHIYRGKDGAYYLAMTDLHVYGVRDGI